MNKGAGSKRKASAVILSDDDKDQIHMGGQRIHSSDSEADIPLSILSQQRALASGAGSSTSQTSDHRQRQKHQQEQEQEQERNVVRKPRRRAKVGKATTASCSKSKTEQDPIMPFYCCYMLASTVPRYRTHAYVGSTPDPVKRLRQHNGDLTQGAKKTSKKRPWKMVLLVHGFPTKVAALQFEWAWQYPERSRQFEKVKQVATNTSTSPQTQDPSLVIAPDDSRSGNKIPGKRRMRPPTTVQDKLQTLFNMMRRPSWIRWPLTVHIMDTALQEPWEALEKRYQQALETISQKNLLRRSDLQKPITVSLGSMMDVAPLFTSRGHSFVKIKEKVQERHDYFKEQAFKCTVCEKPIDYDNISESYLSCSNEFEECDMVAHIECIADFMLKQDDPPTATLSSDARQTTSELLPTKGVCKVCHCDMSWIVMIRTMSIRKQGLSFDTEQASE
ncbi:Slx4p interacting protein [Podila epigama]|nr:Slx4p interacting protein [Podila epigama]